MPSAFKGLITKTPKLMFLNHNVASSMWWGFEQHWTMSWKTLIHLTRLYPRKRQWLNTVARITTHDNLVNYQVDIHDRMKRFRVFHVNMLKVYLILRTLERVKYHFGMTWPREIQKTGKHLSEAQQKCC